MKLNPKKWQQPYNHLKRLFFLNKNSLNVLGLFFCGIKKEQDKYKIELSYQNYPKK